MEHIVDFVCFALMVQILIAPVPQMAEQRPDVLQFFDTPTTDPEQVIEVPKIFPEDVPMRTSLHDTQLAEQLVEVPTIVSCSWLPLSTEQNVGIPVPHRGGRHAGLQGFHPEQSSSALHGSQERIIERIVEQIVNFPVGGDLQDFRPRQSSSSSSHVPARVPEALDAPGGGVFRTFPHNNKSWKLGPHSSPRVPASVSSSTRAPQHRVRLWEWVMLLTDQGPFYWNRDTGESRWKLGDGFLPGWWLRPDGHNVDLRDI